MEQKQFWNNVAEEKQFTTPFQAEAFCRFVPKESVILDVGCGYGRTLCELQGYGYSNLIGIDFSEEMIKRGKTQFPQLDLRVKSGAAIDMPDASVDAVILFAVLTCICSDADQAALIAEIHRVLKPGGVLYVNDFLLNSDERNLARYEKFKEKYGCYGVFELPEGAVLRHHDEAWLPKLLENFTLHEFGRLVFTTMNGNKSNGFFYFGRK